MSKVLLTILTVLLIVPFQLAAQDDAAPSVAILRFGPSPAVALTEGAILDVLESYGYISADENRQLEEGANLEGENLSVFWGDAGSDLASVNLIVEAALDRDVDVIVALSTPVAQIATAITSDLDDPPAVLFAMVQVPFRAGIASSSCIKPDHVGGALFQSNYKTVLDTLRLQDPGLDTVGFVYATTMASGEYAYERITEVAMDMGIEALDAGVVSLSDLSAAAQGLIDRGAGALLVSGDYLMTAGLPIVVAVANENSVPVFHPSAGAIMSGVTIATGYSTFYAGGDKIGVILNGVLNGDLDLAGSMIHSDVSARDDAFLGINKDSAAEQNVEISEALLSQARAMIVVSGGSLSLTETSPVVLQEFARQGVIVPMDDRLESDMAFLASLECTDDMIAEQQAELDAAE